MLPKRELYPV